MSLDRKQCLYCDKWFTPKKVGQKYHSDGCRKSAWRSRKLAADRIQKNSLYPDELVDVKAIKSVSDTAGEFILKVCAMFGADLGRLALEAIWDFAVQGGFYYQDGVLVHVGVKTNELA